MATHQIRVLVAKPGLDGHDRGAKVVARALKDAGVEVIYTGLHRTPAEVAEAALQEDVDVIGLSILSGAHMKLCEKLLAELEARGIGGAIPIILGGAIPAPDVPNLEAMGIDRVFPTGTPLSEIVEWIQNLTNAGRSVTNA